MSDVEKKRARNDEPLTQITIMDAVCAYRLGGWEQAKSKVVEASARVKQSNLVEPLVRQAKARAEAARAQVATARAVRSGPGTARRPNLMPQLVPGANGFAEGPPRG